MAAVLDCRRQHGIPQVSLETFLGTQQLKKDLPQLSSKIREIRLLCVVKCDLGRPKRPWDQRKKRRESRKTSQKLLQASKEDLVYSIILVELILTVLWLIIRDFLSRKCILENSQTLWNFNAGTSTSRLKFAQRQQILISQCSGSKKLA